MSEPRLPAVRIGASPIRGIEYAAVAAAGAILVVFRLHAFDLPLETDECNYAYIGARLLAGDRLYVDVWDHQPFGVFALFAAVMVAFGDAPHVFRWMAMGFSLISLWLVYAILRRLAGRGAAILGALLFALVSSDPGTGGEGCNREIYMNTFILAGWYLALRSTSHARLRLFGSGCALAIASSLKTIVAVHWVFLAVWIAWDEVGRSLGARRPAAPARHLAWFALGPLILWGAAFAYFAATGRSHEFVDAVFEFNLGYSDSSEPFLMRFVRFFAPIKHKFIFDSALPLWIGAAIGTLSLMERVAHRRDIGAGASLLFVAAGYVAICLPGRFWPHYYYLLIPALCVAMALLIQRVCSFLVRWRTEAPALSRGASVDSRQARRLIDVLGRLDAVAVCVAVSVALMATEARDYLLQPPFGITVKRYNSRDFWGRAQGENIAKVTDPGDRIFVFGNEAEIYYYSQRRCASRYTMITGLAAGMRGADDRRRILMQELRAAPPRLIAVLFDEQPWEEWKTFLREYYTDPVGWDFNDKTREPIMFVVARKDRPVQPIDWDWDRSAVGGWQLGERRWRLRWGRGLT